MNKSNYRNFKSPTTNSTPELFVISKRFAWVPTFVDGNLTWFSSYFKLKQLDAICFGGITSFSYKSILNSKSLFKFKNLLKEEGVIRNLYKNNCELKKKMSDPRMIELVNKLKQLKGEL